MFALSCATFLDILRNMLYDKDTTQEKGGQQNMAYKKNLIEQAMEEVNNAKSWKKLGKAIKLYALCTTPAPMTMGNETR